MPELEPHQADSESTEPTIEMLLEVCKDDLSEAAINDIVGNNLDYQEAIGFLFSYLPEMGIDPVEYLAEKGLLE